MERQATTKAEAQAQAKAKAKAQAKAKAIAHANVEGGEVHADEQRGKAKKGQWGPMSAHRHSQLAQAMHELCVLRHLHNRLNKWRPEHQRRKQLTEIGSTICTHRHFCYAITNRVMLWPRHQHVQ